MRNFALFAICLVFLNCSSSDNDNNKPEENNELTKAEVELLSLFEHMGLNAESEWEGPGLTAKWAGNVKIYLDGNITEEYTNESQEVITKLNTFLTDGTSFSLTDNKEDAHVHLFLGSRAEVEELWPDMATTMGGKPYTGFYLYEWDSNYNIFGGRLWVGNTGMPIFRHELGHILGLGHADASGCGTGQRSVMCSGLASDFSDADETIIRLLYHPSVPTGKTYEELREIIEKLLKE